MPELNQLLDTASQTAEALSAHAREIAGALHELRTSRLPAAEERLEQALAANREHLGALTARLDAWEAGLDAAGHALDEARAATHAGAEQARTHVGELVEFQRELIESVLTREITTLQHDLQARHDATLERLGNVVEQLQAARNHLDEQKQELDEQSFGPFQTMLLAAFEDLQEARTSQLEGVELAGQGVEAAHDALGEAMASAGDALREAVAGALASLHERFQHGEGDLRRHLVEEGHAHLATARETAEREGTELQLRLQMMIDRWSEAMTMLSNVAAKLHESQTAIIDNLR